MFFISVCVCLLATFNLEGVGGALTKRSPDDLPIKYPGPLKPIDQNRYGTTHDDDVPESCKGKTFCTLKPENYPEKRYNELYKDVMKNTLPSVQLLPFDALNSRQGDPNDKDDCDVRVTYEPLYRVRQKRGDSFRTVVQVPEAGYVQRVRLEECLNEEASCFTAFTAIPGYVTHCKQKYASYQFLVDDGKNGTEPFVADLPICCSCHYKSVDLEDRFNKPVTPVKTNNRKP